MSAVRLCIGIMFTATFAAAQSGWTWRNPLPQGNSIYEVLATDAGFVADTRSGTILTSPDGVDWTVHNLDMPGTVHDLVWAGDRLVALGDSGRVGLSADGTAWTVHTTGSSATLLQGVWDGSKLVAVADDRMVYISPDGESWTVYPLQKEWAVPNALLWSGSCFTVVHDAWNLTYRDSIHVSPDGMTWYGIGKTGQRDPAMMADFNGRTFAVDTRGTVFEVTACTTWADTADLGFAPTDLVVTGSRLLAVGSGGYVARTVDGYAWSVLQHCSGGLFGPYFTAAAWDGRYAFAVGTKGMNFRWSENGSGSGICGVTGQAALSDVACCDTTVVTVGPGGYLLSGPDTGPREQRRRGTVAGLRRVIWAGGRGLACGTGGTVVTSDDGLVWQAESTGVAADLNDIAYTGSFYAAAGAGGVIVSSPDGHTWLPCTTRIAVDFEKVISTGDGALAIGLSGQTLVSAWSGNGRTWVTSVLAGGTISIGGVTWNGEQAVVGADVADIYVSQDCSTWTVHSSGMAQYIAGLAWHDSLYVLIHDYLMIGTSEDGTTWTERKRYGKDLWDVVWAGSQWVAVGEDLTVVTSPDGITWTTRSAGTGTDDLREVIWNGGLLLARGDAALYSSPDAVTWTKYDPGAEAALTSLAWTGTVFLAAGGNGTILSAPQDPVSRVYDSGTVRRPGRMMSVMAVPGRRLVITGGVPGTRAVWRITDVMGRQVLCGMVDTATSVDITGLPTGMYVYRIRAAGSVVRGIFVTVR